MAQLAIAAVGAAIGGAIAPGAVFLGLTGASIGWTVGSIIGAQFGPKQRSYGPRLEDLKVTGVEYGQPIPWLAGHPRVAGQVWWSSEKREIATTTEVGKGGGGAEYTTYTYEVDLLIGLADREIAGVSRIWSNGKLVYTKLADSGVESALSSKSQNVWSRMTVYTGASDQLPDPTYEQAVGIGNAPAYRGRGTVFIEGLQLGSSGQLPNLTFEVYTAGEEEGRTPVNLGTFAYTLGQRGGVPAFSLPDFTMHVQNQTTGLADVYRFTLGLEEMELINSYSYVSGNNPTFATSSTHSGQFLSNLGSTAANWYDDDGVATAFTLPYNINSGFTAVVFHRNGGDVYISDYRAAGQKRVYRYTSAGGTHAVASSAMTNSIMSMAATADTVYALSYDATAPTDVYKLDRDTLALLDTLSPPPGTSDEGQLLVDDSGNIYCYNGALSMYRLDGTSWTLVKTISGGIEYGQLGTRVGAYGGDLWAIAPPGGGNDAILRVVFDSVDLLEATLSDTVDELCERAGMPAGSWESTGLDSITKPVRALTVAQVSPVRSVLEQLAAAYFFDAYLADKLYFVPRGGASAATVPAEDLGCGEEQPAAETLPKRVGNETEIPAQMALSYANADADYNTATEHSDRLLTSQLTTNTVQLPMAFTAAEAKGIVDAMLADGFAGRVTGEAALGLQYARHTPTDVLTLTDDDGSTYRARLVRVTHSGPLVSAEWVLDDASALTSAGLTSDDYAPSLTVALPGPTSIELLDIPILRDADDSPGIYSAAKPVGTAWPGAKLMESIAGADYVEVGTFTSRAVFGVTTVALTNWTGGNVFDESGSVTVDVGGGELSNATRDAVLDSDANAMLVGSEIIQFRTATLQSAGIYKLTGLLRGRRGTEWAMTGHAVGERCVLLRTAGLVRVGYDAARIGIEAAYKGVTLGKLLSSATRRTITDTGIALKPFAPVNLRQNTAVPGQVTITWDRRTRLSARWPSTMTPPLGEESESYEVELLNLSSSVVEEQTVTSASVTFGLATQQITLDEGVAMLAKIGGSYYGVQQETDGAVQILQQSATTGALEASSLTLGSRNSWCDLVANGGQLFVTNNALSAGTPATVLSSVIQRIDPADLSTVAASYSLPDAGDAYALYHDGTHLWTAGYLSGDLIQLNGTTLASVSATLLEIGLWGITGDGSWLFLSNYNTGDVFAYEFGAGTPEKWRTAVGGYPQYLHERDGLLYVFTSTGVTVLNASTGAVVYTHAGLASAGLAARPFVDFGAYVAYKRSGSQYVVLLDATTGDISSEVSISGILGLAGADGTTLLAYAPAAGREPTSTDLETRGYTLEGSLAGFKVRVYQMSATVGRGYVAEHTIF